MTIRKYFPLVVLGFSLAYVAACRPPIVEVEPEWFMMGDDAIPAARWDHLSEGKYWSRMSMSTLIDGSGRPLIQMVPDDIADWCPAYAENDDPMSRSAFWVGLLSAMAKHESTYNPQAVGGDGQWFGLLQISPATAQGYGCEATTGEALKHPTANLYCAIRIIAQTVPRDGVVAAGRGGVAADWGPFRNDAKRADMRGWTSQQSYCR